MHALTASAKSLRRIPSRRQRSLHRQEAINSLRCPSSLRAPRSLRNSERPAFLGGEGIRTYSSLTLPLIHPQKGIHKTGERVGRAHYKPRSGRGVGSAVNEQGKPHQVGSREEGSMKLFSASRETTEFDSDREDVSWTSRSLTLQLLVFLCAAVGWGGRDQRLAESCQ